MKKVFMMLFATIALSACSKDNEAPKAKPQPVTVELNALAEVNSEPQPSNSKQARAMDYRFVGNEIKYSLEGKTEVSVHTYIYDGDEQIFSKELLWRVNNTKTGISFNAPIRLTAQPQTNNVKLVAIIADGVHKDHVINMTSTDNYSVGKLYSTSDRPKINVPYIMQTPLRRGTRGGEATLDNFTQPNKKFKPQGYLLRCKLRNSLNEPITVQGLVSYNTLPEKVSITIPELELVNEPEGGRSTHGFKNVYFDNSQKLTIPAGGEAPKFMLLWIPTLTTPTKYQLDLLLYNPTATAKAGYTTSLFSQEPSYYTAGKIYDVTLDLQTLTNPLSLISEYPLNSDGTGFLTDWNDYAPGQPRGTKNTQVGYFNTVYANSNFVTPKRYGTSDLWHLPTAAELSSIFPNAFNSYLATINGRQVEYDFANGFQEPDFLPRNSRVFIDDVQVGGYRRTVQTQYFINGPVFAILFGAVPESKLGNTKFPPETTNDRMHLACYERDDIRKVWKISIIKYPSEGFNPNHIDMSIFNRYGVVKRTIPMYGMDPDLGVGLTTFGDVAYIRGQEYDARLKKIPTIDLSQRGVIHKLPIYLFRKP